MTEWATVFQRCFSGLRRALGRGFKIRTVYVPDGVLDEILNSPETDKRFALVPPLYYVHGPDKIEIRQSGSALPGTIQVVLEFPVAND